MEGLKVECTITPKDLRKIAVMAAEIVEDKKNAPQEKQEKIAYTVNEIEDLYSIDARTLTRHIRQGLLTAGKPGKSYVVLKKDLETYIKSNSK